MSTRTARAAKSSENATRQTPVDPADFLAGVPDATRRADAERVVGMMRSISAEPPRMWGASIIGFGQYSYRYESGHGGEFARLGLSPRGTALVVYLIAGFEGNEPLLARLGKHSTGKSCLYIKRLADVDEGVLRDLIQLTWDEMARRYP
jgi:hypothetical protein